MDELWGVSGTENATQESKDSIGVGIGVASVTAVDPAAAGMEQKNI